MLEIVDSDRPLYFWLYLNLKKLSNTDLGGLMLFLSSESTLSTEDITALLCCLLKGKPIRRFYREIPDSLKARFSFPRDKLETWKEAEESSLSFY